MNVEDLDYSYNPKTKKIEQCLYTFGTHTYREKLLFEKFYGNENKYNFFDEPHSDILNVDRINDIPNDYFGVIAVPITYLYYHDNNVFEIIGYNEDKKNWHINGKLKYYRVLIKRRVPPIPYFTIDEIESLIGCNDVKQ